MNYFSIAPHMATPMLEQADIIFKELLKKGCEDNKTS